jgi:hypothetical protein
MHVSFVTPEAALLALTGLVALGCLAAGERRLQRLRDLLGLRRAAAGSSIGVGAAIAALCLLLTLAATQPVIASATTKKGRADTDVYFVFDVSRSMSARASASAPMRLARARRDGETLRGLLPDLAIGVASLNDRLLPHLFPTVSSTAFAATVERALGINKPRAALFYGSAGLGTKLASIGDLATEGYFAAAQKRVAVVFTDGETLRQGLSALPSQLQQAHVRTFFVRYWDAHERIFDQAGGVDAGYVADPASGPLLDALARSLETKVFREGDAGGVARAIRAAVGHGPHGTRERDLGSFSLAPYLVALAFPLLAFILLRRHGMEVFRHLARRGTTPA